MVDAHGGRDEYGPYTLLLSESPCKKVTQTLVQRRARQGQRTTNTPFGHALSRLADQRPEIVGLSADLAKYTDMHIFRFVYFI